MHEEDLRWLANLAFGVSFVIIFAGTFCAQSFQGGERIYLLVASIALGLAFGAFGCWARYRVWRDIKRTTIRRPGGGE